MSNDIPVSGICDSQFAQVKEAFMSNFADKGEVGARVSIIKDGETVVDLCGGYLSEAKDQTWDNETLVCCMSVTKGIVALAAHLLAERGQLNYDAPVAEYWPEFADNGKAEITVRQVMSHQASLAIIDQVESGDARNWDLFTSKIAAQVPNWPPLTNETYHSLTFGYLVGEIVRRVDGRSVSQFIDEELAKPLGADYLLGCPDEILKRVTHHIFNPENELMGQGAS